MRWLIVGGVLGIVSTRINIKSIKTYSMHIMALTVVLMILVLIPGIGGKYLGARRWIELFGISFQPSEFAKLSMSIYLARLYESNRKTYAYLIPFIICAVLVLLEPDLGTVLIIASIVFVQLYFSGKSVKVLLTLIVIGLISVAAIIFVSPYRKERLHNYLNESRDPFGKGYHSRQLLLSLGSGGLWGVGLGNSKQRNLFLPEAATDSVFAIAAEELGFVKTSGLLLLYLLLFLIGIRIISDIDGKFEKVFSYGIIAWLFSQTVLNLASTTGLVPITGVPLPLFSHGGSSLISIMIGLGLFINVTLNKYEK